MPVASHYKLCIYLFQLIQHIGIVEHGTVHGIMVYKDYGLLLVNCIRYRVEPYHALARQQSRGHAHVRAAVGSYEFYALEVELELLISKHLYKCVAAALRPLCVMVAGYDVIGFVQLVENRFSKFNLPVCAELRNISGNYGKGEFIIPVYVIYAGLQVFYAGRTLGDVGIRKIGKLELL